MKKIITAFLSLICAACLVVGIVACGKNDKSHTITVMSMASIAVEDVTVELYDGEKRVAQGKTDENGKVKFEIKLGEYKIEVSDLPVGFDQPEKEYKTSAKGGNANVYLPSHVITEEEMPTGYLYNLGDVMYDFEARGVKGETFKLSNVLSKKKMVFVNFWATTCGPCVAEMPFLSTAYTNPTTKDPNKRYNEEMEVIALSISDSESAITTFLNSNQMDLSYLVGANGSKMYRATGGNGSVPYSIIIDRYGILSWIHTGSLATAAEFQAYFDKYIADDYQPDDLNDTDNEEIVRPLPDVTMPESSVLEAAANAEGFTGTYRPETETQDKEYSWPWLAEEKDGKSYIYASNRHGIQKTSFATVYLDVHMQKDQVFAFDYYTSIEHTDNGSDYLYFMKRDDTGYLQILEIFTGISEGWETYFGYIATEESDYTFVFLYVTDAANPTNSVVKDEVMLSNLRFTDVKDLEDSNAEREIMYQCATQATGVGTDEMKWTQYVQVGYNENDGYYHLLDANNEPNGPYVLAPMTQENTHWSNYSIFQYADNQVPGETCVFDGVDYRPTLIEYANVSVYSRIAGYTPVNAELQSILVKMTQEFGSGNQNSNEWLEICHYFVYYGANPESSALHRDPIVGLTKGKATELKETTGKTDPATWNEINIDSPMRGIYYKFVPDNTAVYEFTSYGKNANNEDLDTYAWIEDTKGNILSLFHDNTASALNIYAPLAAGETYYVRCCFYSPDELGKYQLAVNNVGARKVIRQNVSDGAYTFDLNEYEETGNYYNIVSTIVDKSNIVKNSDGEWTVRNTNQKTMSKVYADFFNSTHLFNGGSIKELIAGKTANGKPIAYFLKDKANGNLIPRPGVDPDSAISDNEKYLWLNLSFDFSADVVTTLQKQFPETDMEQYLRTYGFDFDLRKGKNYTADMTRYLAEAEANGGFVAVDEKLETILTELTKRVSIMRSKRTEKLTNGQTQIVVEYVPNEWWLMCYYDQVYDVEDLNED